MPFVPPYLPHQPGVQPWSRDLVEAQSRVQRTVEPLQRKPWLSGGELIEGVSLTSAIENWLEHGLGRDVRGWFLTDIDTATHVWRVTTSDADLGKFLPLGCSYDCSIDLVVF